jgi:hypothetical protein
MKKYTTEIFHPFQDQLYKMLNAFSVENLTMNYERNFTSIIDYFELDEAESLNLTKVIVDNKCDSKLLLAKNLKIPYFLVFFQKDFFYIFNYDGNQQKQLNHLKLNEIEFILWFKKIKQTHQTHQLNNGGQSRILNFHLTDLLIKNGLSWGGNLDGFVIENNRIKAIIDNISIAFTSIDNFMADPAKFFFKRGPRYETGLSTVKIANTLKVPHLLLTLNKNNPQEEVIGLTAIKNLNKNGVYYHEGIKPFENVIYGYENILRNIHQYINKVDFPNFE